MTPWSSTYESDGLNRLKGLEFGVMTTGSISTVVQKEDWQTGGTLKLDQVGNWVDYKRTRESAAQDDWAGNTFSKINVYTKVDKVTGTDIEPEVDKKGLPKWDDKTGGTAVGYQYVFDAWDRLVTVKNTAGTVVEEFRYNGLSSRQSAQLHPLYWHLPPASPQSRYLIVSGIYETDIRVLSSPTAPRRAPWHAPNAGLSCSFRNHGHHRTRCRLEFLGWLGNWGASGPRWGYPFSMLGGRITTKVFDGVGCHRVWTPREGGCQIGSGHARRTPRAKWRSAPPAERGVRAGFARKRSRLRNSRAGLSHPSPGLRRARAGLGSSPPAENGSHRRCRGRKG